MAMDDDDWWRHYQSTSRNPWDRDKWGEPKAPSSPPERAPLAPDTTAAAIDALREAISPPDAVVPAPEDPDIEDDDALRLLATWLRRLAARR
jgi:hypothetical protein